MYLRENRRNAVTTNNLLRGPEAEQLSVLQRHVDSSLVVDRRATFDRVGGNLLDPIVAAITGVDRDQERIGVFTIGMTGRQQRAVGDHETGEAAIAGSCQIGSGISPPRRVQRAASLTGLGVPGGSGGCRARFTN